MWCREFFWKAIDLGEEEAGEELDVGDLLDGGLELEQADDAARGQVDPRDAVLEFVAPPK